MVNREKKIDADISPLLAKWDDPKMAEDPGVSEVVRQLDQACREAGFFYVVIFYACTLFCISALSVGVSFAV